MGVSYDFSGWATKNDLRCSDGRVIRKDAFIDNNGSTVPLVWNHDHGDSDNILGHALLENRDEGVYAYCSFNDNPKAMSTKNAVKHGDIRYMSIYANHLKQNGCNVMHGAIREVSLVLAGANPGAEIDTILAHSDIGEEEGKITTGIEIELMHADEEKGEDMERELTVKDVYDAMSEQKKECLTAMIALALSDGDVSEDPVDEVRHADTNGPTLKDIFNTFTEDEKMVAYAMIGKALQSRKANAVQHSEEYYAPVAEEEYNYVEHFDNDFPAYEYENNSEFEGEYEEMKHNVFEGEYEMNDAVIQHSDVMAAIDDAKRIGSMREAFIQHGIDDIEYLFPDAHNLDVPPQFVNEDQEWVSVVMGGTTHTPFSRIKSLFADITEDDARALGYLADRTHRDDKGNLVDADGNPAFKKEEVFSLLKRVTTPATIYKKQKIDRDDVIDITDFDVISWLKTEMRGKLNEELARAILMGDSRSVSSDDKINESNIRPILSDSSFFTIKTTITTPTTVTPDAKAKEIIRAAVKSRTKYKGSGNPTFFTTEAYLADLLLLEDGIGHRLYKTEQELAAAMRVSKIVTVPPMANYKNSSNQTVDVVGIIVNLKDYTVGADKGGAVNMFDDFDIDYNAQKYLIETRCSGALTKPFSAIAITAVTSAEATGVSHAIVTSSTIA